MYLLGLTETRTSNADNAKIRYMNPTTITKQDYDNLKSEVDSLKKKIEDLTNPATISEQFLDTLVKKGFFRYADTKILTYTNPSGKDFYAVFAKYGNENTVISIEDQTNFVKIESINTSTNVITITRHGWADTTPVYVVSTNQFPGGLGPQVQYYVRDATTDTFKLAASPGGVAIDITSVGAGANYIRPQ